MKSRPKGRFKEPETEWSQVGMARKSRSDVKEAVARPLTNVMDQCHIVLLETRSREWTLVASRKAKRKQIRASDEAERMKMRIVTIV